MHVHQRRVIRDYQQKIAGKCQDLSTPEGFVIDVLLIVYNKTRENWVILSHYDQVGYSALMLTEGTEVDSSSTREL